MVGSHLIPAVKLVREQGDCWWRGLHLVDDVDAAPAHGLYLYRDRRGYYLRECIDRGGYFERNSARYARFPRKRQWTDYIAHVIDKDSRHAS